MKNKPGKGRKIKKLLKPWKRKTGGGKFMLSGKGTNWGNQIFVPLAVKQPDWIKDRYKKTGDR